LDDDLSGSGSVMLGFSGEIEDMEFEQSWSITVRVINNYLASIYHKRGDTQAAEALEKESKTLTHIADPNPQGKGRAEVASGIQIIWPDALNGDPEATKKRPYDPQFRRNSAIQMAKEAKKLLKNDEKEKALSQYLASNEILKEIYEDGHTGEYYNLIGIQGDLDEIRIMLQKECARDLGLNFSGMISCTPLREDNADLIAYIDDMLAWAHIYDDYRNNKQSKADLENYYLISAQVYNLFDDVAVHCHRIIHDIDQFYTYRLEAHQKGEQTDQAIMEDRDKANHVLYAVATANPHMGAQITDLLLRQSNASVKANDFNGFLSLTQLVENLLLWTGKNSQDWVGTHCSLEYIYFHNMNNQTMLWEKHGMADRLAQDADRILRLLPNARESENVLMGIESVVRHIMQVFGMGEYKKAVPYADAVLAAIRKTVDLPEVELAQIYEKVIATYSEAGLAEKAHAVAMDYEALLDRIEQKGYPEHLRSTDFTPAQFHGFVVKSKLIAYLNHAIALSRMERGEDAKRYLQRAESLAVKNPEIAAQNPGIVQRITLFRKNGLPKPKNLLDNEKVYRKYRDEIEATLSRYLRKAPYTVSDLQHIESLIRKMCAIPEHEIFKNTYALAKYHHVLNMLYAAVGRKDLAFNMLRNAAEIADSADFVDELFAKIYSDIIAYISGTGEQLMYTHKALRIYENLQKEGAQYSQNSYAMALHNASIIYMQQGDLLQALSYAKKALALWERIYSSTPDEQIMAYMGEAKRLIAFLETKIL
jgi:tetratricopeptide (TPR) repeat protein